MRKIVFYVTSVLLPVVLVLASCGQFSGIKMGYVGTNTNHQITGTYQLLDGTETKYISLEAGQTIIFTYKSTVEKGSLTIKFSDPDGKTIVEFTPGTSGTEEVTASKSGNYKLTIKGDDNKGSFDIRWEIK